jgi:hypothetical protein
MPDGLQAGYTLRPYLCAMAYMSRKNHAVTGHKGKNSSIPFYVW